MEQVYYFAYGSNMNQQDLDKYCINRQRPRIDLITKNPRTGILKKYRLDFNYYSSTRGGGAANLEGPLEPDSNEFVEGVLFELTEDEMKTINSKEGAPNYYHQIDVMVALKNGGEVRNVKTYTVVENRKVPFTPPTKEYKQIMIDGAKAFNLSTGWIQKLEKIPTKK